MKNPILTENYVDMDGNRIRLDDIIKEEILELSFIHIELHGTKPSKKKIESWVDRLRNAYYEKKLT